MNRSNAGKYYHPTKRYPTREQKQAAIKESRKRWIAKIRAFVNDWKAERGCVDCGEKDPIVLQFDHRDRKAKKFEIGAAVCRSGVGLARMIAEMEKCDVRCANCHIRHTRKNNDFTAVPGRVTIQLKTRVKNAGRIGRRNK